MKEKGDKMNIFKKKNIARRILSILLSAGILFSVSACSKKSEKESETKIQSPEEAVMTADILPGEIQSEFTKTGRIMTSENYYLAKEISLPEYPDAEFVNVFDIQGNANNIVILSVVTPQGALFDEIEGGKDSDYMLTVLDENANLVRDINLNTIIPEDIAYIQNMVLSDQNEVYVLVYPKSGKQRSETLPLYKLDLSGNLIGECIELDLGFLHEFTVAPNGYIYTFSYEYDPDAAPGKESCGAVTVFDASGSRLFQVKDGQQDKDNQWGFNRTLFSDGDTVYIDGFRYETGEPLVYSIDVEKQALGDLVQFDFFFSPQNIQSGSDGLYYADSKGIKQLDIKNSSNKDILFWENLDIVPTGRYQNIVVLSEDRILIEFYNTDWNANDHDDISFCYMLEKQEQNPHTGKNILQIGGFGLNDNLFVKNAVYRFNQNSTDFRMEIIDYSQISSDSRENQIKTMNAEFLSGNVPDILFSGRDMRDAISFRNYASKNILADLYPLMNADAEFAKTDYFENLLSLPEINGQLFYVFPEYEIHGIIGKTEHFGQFQNGWTRDEFEQAVQFFQIPSDLFGYIDHLALLRQYLEYSLSDFVDYQAGTADFTTDEFKELMAFCKKYSTAPVNISGDMMEYRPEGIQTFSQPDSSGLVVDSISHLRMLSQDRNWIGESFFITGYPHSERGGPMCRPLSLTGITSASLYPEAGWDFIKTLLSEELQLISSDGLKINKNAFEELLTRVMTWREGVDENSDAMLHPLPQETAEMLRHAVLSVGKMGEADPEMIGIVLDEAQGYFADQKSLEETIGVIQSRVTTLMNERG